MKFFLFIAFCICSSQVFGQDDAPFNKINVSSVAPLQFAFNNPLDLLHAQVINNALEVSIKTKQEDTNVYAQLNYSGGQSPFNNLLALRLISKTSPDAEMSKTMVSLSQVPALLFMQPRSLQGSKQYTFNYDLLLNPSQTMISPGTYTFSIDFTITAQ